MGGVTLPLAPRCMAHCTSETNVAGSMLSSPDMTAERKDNIWALCQKLLGKPNALPVLKKCDNSVIINHISIDDVSSLRAVSISC